MLASLQAVTQKQFDHMKMKAATMSCDKCYYLAHGDEKCITTVHIIRFTCDYMLLAGWTTIAFYSTQYNSIVLLFYFIYTLNEYILYNIYCSTLYYRKEENQSSLKVL